MGSIRLFMKENTMFIHKGDSFIPEAGSVASIEKVDANYYNVKVASVPDLGYKNGSIEDILVEVMDGVDCASVLDKNDSISLLSSKVDISRGEAETLLSISQLNGSEESVKDKIVKEILSLSYKDRVDILLKLVDTI